MMATHGHIPKAHRLRWAWLLHLGRSGEWETLAREHDGSTGVTAFDACHCKPSSRQAITPAS